MLERGTFWSGRGQLSMTGASALNPYHALPVVEQAPPMTAENPEGTALFRGRMSIGQVRMLESF